MELVEQAELAELLEERWLLCDSFFNGTTPATFISPCNELGMNFKNELRDKLYQKAP